MINHHPDLTYTIIGCAIEIHQYLGSGLLESAYEKCLIHELTKSGLRVESQIPVPIIYKGIKLDCGFRIDVLVERTVIVELKAMAALHEVHEAQILTHMRFAEKQIGLLINFHSKTIKEGIRRFVL